MFHQSHMKRRVVMMIFGVVVCAFSISLFRLALFGTDPFQCFASGMANKIPITFGTLYMIISLVMLVIDFFLDKRYLGIATLANMFLTGYIIDFGLWILEPRIDNSKMSVRIILLILGVVIMCFSSAFYTTADLGVSVYDTIALVMADRKVAKFRWCRIGTDAICVLVGFLLGAVVGAGTLITALFMGPLIEFFCVTVTRPLLYGKNWREEYEAEKIAKQKAVKKEEK